MLDSELVEAFPLLISVVTANGERISQADPSVLTRFGPREMLSVRIPGAHRRQPNIPGFFWVSQLRTLVWYESRLEMVALKLLDFHMPLAGILPQPFILHFEADGKKRRHIPDFLVWLKDGRRILVNVKPRRYLEKPINKRSFGACVKLCEHLNWTYVTQSEPTPEMHTNLRWLAGFRRTPPMYHLYAGILLERAKEACTIKSILADAGPECLVRPVLFHLMWQKKLQFDMGHVLSNHTVLNRGSEAI